MATSATMMIMTAVPGSTNTGPATGVTIGRLGGGTSGFWVAVAVAVGVGDGTPAVSV